MPRSFLATTAWPARTSRSSLAALAASAEDLRALEERPGIPVRARATSGRGGGGRGLGRFGLGDVVVDVAFVVAEVADEFVVLGERSAGEEAQARASSMSSSSRSQETLMQRPTRRTVVSSGREKWL